MAADAVGQALGGDRLAGSALTAPGVGPTVEFDPDEFRRRIHDLARPLWRELPWRRTTDPYRIWLSEVMLQQTQVARVSDRWDAWLAQFPTIGALAAASDADVLAAWQGMGYNRRALALHRTAQQVEQVHGGHFPRDYAALLALPGVGPSTAAGIRAFAFDEAGVYLETNVRAVFIHEFFGAPELLGTSEPLGAPGAPGASEALGAPEPLGAPELPGASGASAKKIPDSALIPLVAAACPATGCDVRGWYYALLDYGAWLKKSTVNPTRRSGSYTRQSKFEGSLRQKRAEVVRILLAAHQEGVGALTLAQVVELLGTEERSSGRPEPPQAVVTEILAALAKEGFCSQGPDGWSIAG